MFYLLISYHYSEFDSFGTLCTYSGTKHFTADKLGFEKFLIWYFSICKINFRLDDFEFINLESLFNILDSEKLL